ncbi:ATP-binding cassette domain-containing protein [Caenispirillum salinarum]|uniref:ATP-binding cassette domain-containing protein n=1 Tax=Caenispirillum salinarum TaxID=859058 RepID=UPI00384F4A96
MHIILEHPRPSGASVQTSDTPLIPLRVEGLSFAAGGRDLLRDISFSLTTSLPTFLLGHNGAGKSLLLRLLHGLVKPESGRISWGGLPVAEAARHQAMVFQRPVMLRRPVLDNLVYALAMRRVPRRQRRDLAMAALEEAGLAHLAGRQARVLSGGEQQLVALAQARALRPLVLFLDEPTASLDPAHSAAVERAVASVVAAGIKVIMASHDLAQARRLAHDVLFMADGRLVEFGAADAFLTEPRSELGRRFLAGDLTA